MGGELKIDESVSTGAARYDAPIPIPPGRAGVEPNILLKYNSQNENGFTGVG